MMAIGYFSSVLWFVACVLLGWAFQRRSKRRKRLPPGPRPLPLLGNLLQLDREFPHHTLDEWGRRFGHVYTVWLGNQANVVVTDAKLIRSLLTGRDADALAGRPNDNKLFRHMSQGRYGVILLDGEEWREQRRFSLHILRDFGFGRSGMETRIREQVADLVTHLKAPATFIHTNFDRQTQVLVEGCIADGGGSYEECLEMPIQTCVGNIINTVVYGFSYPYNDPTFEWLKEMLSSNFRLVQTPQALMIQQSFWTRHIPGFRHIYAQLMQNNEAMSGFLLKDIRRITQSYDPKDEPSCYVQSYLQEMERRKVEGLEPGHFSEWQLTMITGDMWAAGMETTVTTLGWALLYLLHHPDWQDHIQEELRSVLADGEEVEMSHRAQMPRLCAFVLESQRLANIIPINLQHRTTRQVEIGGRVIPEDTVVIPQLSSVHLDEEIFPEPRAFRPERFLGPDGGLLKDKAEMVIPFSLGKRSCLGESLARMELFLIMASLLRHFHFAVPKGEEAPSLRPQPGITATTKPYKVLLTAR